MQVGPLKEQSETAKKYLSLRNELKTQEISVWMETLDKLRAGAETINTDYEAAKKNLEEAHREAGCAVRLVGQPPGAYAPQGRGGGRGQDQAFQN
jgi:chromosome segregation ATPase